MGHGSVSSHRWQPDRKPTPQEEITYWQSKALQYKAERDYADKQLHLLALRIARQNKELAAYHLSYGSIMFDSEVQE